jgi:voltage-gated potassium channel
MKRRSHEEREQLLERFERWTEWPLTVLALILIPILLGPYVLSLSSETRDTLEQLDYAIWGVFVAHLLIAIVIAPRRAHYLRTHWLDVLLVVLPMFRPLRSLRAFRALRVLTSVNRVVFGARQIFLRRGLQYVMLVSLLIVIVAGSTVTILERDAESATIRSLPDGLWWAVTTVTTVGYGDTYPRTAAGRGLGVALMLVGVGLFGALTASLAAFFVEGDKSDLADEMSALRLEIERLNHALTERQESH